MPLTFDVGGRASGRKVAMMTIEDTLENIGASVALNVLSWEEILPIDLEHSIRTAQKRLNEYCDVKRHPNPHGLSGFSIFPHEPFVQQSIIGPTMEVVEKYKITHSVGLEGKVGFVLVGCVCYRSTFELQTAPTHQTRFIYYLGVPGAEGGFNPYILPVGTASAVRLMMMPNGFSAD